MCHEKGKDNCSKCKETIFVRPKQRHGYPNHGIDLTPIGDTCSCNKVFVEPAALPKPKACPHKVRDNFQWFWNWHNLLKRKTLEAMINTNQACINRLHKRLTNLENIETEYLPMST